MVSYSQYHPSRRDALQQVDDTVERGLLGVSSFERLERFPLASPFRGGSLFGVTKLIVRGRRGDAEGALRAEEDEEVEGTEDVEVALSYNGIRIGGTADCLEDTLRGPTEAIILRARMVRARAPAGGRTAAAAGSRAVCGRGSSRAAEEARPEVGRT